MTLPEVTRLAQLGEGHTIEFKRKVPRPERIAKEIIAFANTDGGNLLLGVDDDGTVVGLRDAEEESFALLGAMAAHCDPPVPFATERVAVTKKRDVIVVQVPASERRPHFLVDPENAGTPTAYVRIDDMSVEASREAVRIMKAAREPADTLFQFGEKEQLLMRYLEAYGRITVEQFAGLAGVPTRSASQTLVLLARAEVLRLHADPKQDYFTLSYPLQG